VDRKGPANGEVSKEGFTTETQRTQSREKTEKKNFDRINRMNKKIEFDPV
jgi:hypothetical protein